MKKYLGVKLVNAKPETKDGIEGYLVIYEDGYKSWCPKDVFEKNNNEIESMTFGHALELLKKGFKISRKGWNGKNMYIQFNKSRKFEFSKLESFLTIKNTKNSFDTWVPSISDLMAEDWNIFEEK